MAIVDAPLQEMERGDAMAMTRLADGEKRPVRRLMWTFLGFSLAFASAMTAIFAALLFGIGVAGGFLVRSRPDTSRIINYDPSTVVAKSPLVALIAFVFAVVFAVIASRLRRSK